MTRLGESVARASSLLSADLSADSTVAELLKETGARRYLDLTDLPAKEQAELIASRTVEVLPGVDQLAERIEERRAAGKGLHIKLGIDDRHRRPPRARGAADHPEPVPAARTRRDADHR